MTQAPSPVSCRPLSVIVCALLVAGMPILRAQDHLNFIVSFIDATGSPVIDIRADEVVMVEDGLQGSIVHLEPMERQLDVTLLIDNGVGMGGALAEMRTGAKALFSALPDGSQMSLLTISPQPRWVQRPTSDKLVVIRAVDRITPDESAGRFLDGLVETGERMGKQSETRFPVVIAIGSNGPEGSTALERDFTRLAKRLVDYSATVHVTIVSTNVRLTGGRLPGGVTSNMQMAIGTELTKLTGGRYEQIAVTSRLATLLPELGNQIRAESRRFRLRARRPDGARGAPGVIQFATPRAGVTIRSAFDNVSK